MKKGKVRGELGAVVSNAAQPEMTLGESAAAAAGQLMAKRLPEPAGQDAAPCHDSAGAIGDNELGNSRSLSALKERCLAFGIDATSAELLTAGLHLLSGQPDTALEVAILQSLRADRSFAKRRVRR